MRLHKSINYSCDKLAVRMTEYMNFQVQRLSASNSHEMKGTADTLVMILRTHGWKQLFSGLSLNYLKVRNRLHIDWPLLPFVSIMLTDHYTMFDNKVVPSVAIGFTVYDMMKAYLRVPSRDDAVVEVVTSNRDSQPSTLHS